MIPISTMPHTTDSRTKMIERVRTLLAKAASSEFEAETEAFETKAFRLMADHEIEERELRKASDFDEHVVDLTAFGRAGKGAACLAAGLADLFGGYAVLWSIGDGRSGRVKLFCTPHQREQVDLLLDHLLPQLRASLTRDRPRSRMSYSMAWAGRVHERLRSAQEEVYRECRALVPTNVQARAAFETEYGPARRQRPSIDPRSAISGDLAGTQADLNQQRLTDRDRSSPSLFAR